MGICISNWYKLLLGFSVLWIFPFQESWGTPIEVIIIRHGEKQISPKEPGLTPAGKERSGALAFFFQVDPFVLEHGLPSAIYAFKSTPQSHRAVETVTPLSKAIKIPIQSPFRSELVTELANLILNSPILDGKTVLICWEHKVIPDLILALKGPQTPEYPEDRYDLIYKLTYKNPSAPELCVGSQNLMQDDPKTLPANFVPLQCK